MTYWSRKRSHKLDESRKNQNVSISSVSVYDSVDYDPVLVKTRLSESEAELEAEELITRSEIEHCDWFILSLDHNRRSVSRIGVLLPTPPI